MTETLKDRIDKTNDIQLRIERSEDGQNLTIFIQAPALAAVVSKMTPGYYRREAYSPIYADILGVVADSDGKSVVTRPAVSKITRLFVTGTDFQWSESPRAILLANPEKLAAGFTLSYKLEAPVPPDLVKRWGKSFMDGCREIMVNAKPFRMSWVMSEDA